MKPNKRNGVVILDQKLGNTVLQEIILNTSKLKKLENDPTLKPKPSLKRFLHKLKQKKFFDKNNMINCILLVLTLLAPIVLAKCTYFPLLIYFLNFV